MMLIQRCKGTVPGRVRTLLLLGALLLTLSTSDARAADGCSGLFCNASLGAGETVKAEPAVLQQEPPKAQPAVLQQEAPTGSDSAARDPATGGDARLQPAVVRDGDTSLTRAGTGGQAGVPGQPGPWRGPARERAPVLDTRTGQCNLNGQIVACQYSSICKQSDGTEVGCRQAKGSAGQAGKGKYECQNPDGSFTPCSATFSHDALDYQRFVTDPRKARDGQKVGAGIRLNAAPDGSGSVFGMELFEGRKVAGKQFETGKSYDRSGAKHRPGGGGERYTYFQGKGDTGRQYLGGEVEAKTPSHAAAMLCEHWKKNYDQKCKLYSGGKNGLWGHFGKQLTKDFRNGKTRLPSEEEFHKFLRSQPEYKPGSRYQKDLDARIAAQKNTRDRVEWRKVGETHLGRTPDDFGESRRVLQEVQRWQRDAARKPVAKAPPRQTVPRPTVPRQTVPRQTVPRQTVPRQTVPRQTVPRQTVPRQTVPRQTVPKQTTPAPRAPTYAWQQESERWGSTSYEVAGTKARIAELEAIKKPTCPNPRGAAACKRRWKAEKQRIDQELATLRPKLKAGSAALQALEKNRTAAIRGMDRTRLAKLRADLKARQDWYRRNRYGPYRTLWCITDDCARRRDTQIQEYKALEDQVRLIDRLLNSAT